MPDRCENCKMLVGWLPPQSNCGERAPLKQHPCYKQELKEEPVSKKTEDFLNSVFKENSRKQNNTNESNRDRSEAKKRAKARRAHNRRQRETQPNLI